MNALEKVVGILLAVLLLFVVPMNYLAQKQDAITQSYVTAETTKFVDAIRNNGYLTADMYNEYLRKIDSTNNLYTIKMEHVHQVINPLYDEASGSFQDVTSTNYYNTYQEDILKELFEGSGTYHFSQGDYISVKVVNRNKTYAARLQQKIYAHEMTDIQIYVTYGGMIRDENY